MVMDIHPIDGPTLNRVWWALEGGNAMTPKLIYMNGGYRVEVSGTIVVRLPDGREVCRYPVERVSDAVDLADELAEQAA